MPQVRRRIRPGSYLLIYGLLTAILILAHGPLLRLPYYWDEAGQFIPAATDLYNDGSWITHSATPNVHPPGVMAWLATAWHLFGYSILTTRVAMLTLASFGVLMTFLLAIELSRGSPGAPAFATVALLCLSPLFYAQAILAQLDMPAMGFTALALLLFLQDRFRAAALACVALVLVKETGIVVPLTFAALLWWERRNQALSAILWFLLPVAPLAIWLVALRYFTGHWLGNAGFASYNLQFPLNPVRLLFALLRRMYYLFIGSGHFIGTAAVLYAWKKMPLLHGRPWRVAAIVGAAHVAAVSLLGGAVLERYLLPVLPILYTGFAVASQALLVRTGRIALVCLAACLIVANFVNPPYPFPFENNLMFVNFIEIEQEAAVAAASYNGTVVTTFPMTTALDQPRNGYLIQHHNVREVPDFRPETVAALKNDPPPLMLVYSTEIDPWHIRNTQAFQRFFGRYYQYEHPMSAGEISQQLGVRIARSWEKQGFTMSLLVQPSERP